MFRLPPRLGARGLHGPRRGHRLRHGLVCRLLLGGGGAGVLLAGGRGGVAFLGGNRSLLSPPAHHKPRFLVKAT